MDEAQSQSSPARPSKWWETGTRPDYRFSLANERTFLAWIRTALALIAGAIGIDQFASHLAPPQVRITLSLVLLASGATLGALSYKRWIRVEQAMRQESNLPGSVLLPIAALVTTGLALFLIVLVV